MPNGVFICDAFQRRTRSSLWLGFEFVSIELNLQSTLIQRIYGGANEVMKMLIARTL